MQDDKKNIFLTLQYFLNPHHIMKYLFSLLLLCQIIGLSAKERVDSILSVLDSEIEHREIYYQQKEKKLEDIKQQFRYVKNQQEKYNLCNRLFNEYITYQYDSAYSYAIQTEGISHRLTDKNLSIQADCNLFYCYLSTGLFKEAYDMMRSIHVANAPDSIKSEYYQLCMRLYSDMSSYNEGTPFNADYNKKITLYCDSALLYTPDHTFYHQKIEAFKFSVGDNEKKIQMYKQMLNDYDVCPHEKAIIYSMLGRMYIGMGDFEHAIYYMALSAIQDIRSATRETTAKKELSSYLYGKGDVLRASRYIQIALEETNFYNARHRKMEINTILPIIEKQRLTLIEERKREVTISLAVMSLLVISLLVTLSIIYKQMKKLKTAKQSIQQQFNEISEVNGKLQESNEIKDQYIFQSLYGKSDYLDKVENLLKKQDRKLKARQFNDLQITHKEFDIKSERENMFSSFDQTFLKLFPNFLTEYNKFFRPEDQVILDEAGNLPPELRIFALIRLGVTENERIAKFLNLSINTIYVYKARVKGKTNVPKEEFEEYIMQIKKGI